MCFFFSFVCAGALSTPPLHTTSRTVNPARGARCLRKGRLLPHDDLRVQQPHASAQRTPPGGLNRANDQRHNLLRRQPGPFDGVHRARQLPHNLDDVLVVLPQPLLDLRTGVVRTLHQPRQEVGRRRPVLQVVDAPRDGVRAAPLDALDDHLVGHVEQHHVVRHQLLLLQHAQLRQRAREAVQQPPPLPHVLLRHARQQHVDYKLVRDQLACLHEDLRLLAQHRLVLDLAAQQVACADVHEAEVPNKQLALSALPRRRGTRDDHLRRLHAAQRADDEADRVLRLALLDTLAEHRHEAGHVVVGRVLAGRQRVHGAPHGALSVGAAQRHAARAQHDDQHHDQERRRLRTHGARSLRPRGRSGKQVLHPCSPKLNEVQIL
eukprot:Rhum_TRINITY_DN14408_c27_g1::Rhum_TRINITY_DN14408_c27_g1_i1::g.88684::m.88684